MELTFISFNKKMILVQAFQNFPDITLVMFLIPRVNQNIIEVNKNNIIQKNHRTLQGH